MASPRALAYLAYRALVAHPLKRLRARGPGLERFRAAYVSEGLLPTLLQDREVDEAASACISCGLCEPACDLARAAPAVRALGLHAAFRLHGRAGPELALSAAALEACDGCGACEARCPTGVPIARVVRALRARAEAGATLRAARGAQDARTVPGGAPPPGRTRAA
ncbi:4Fe-4S dicluster domain-containing protein [Anaeromyxobacter sp. PSR-1]|uniref:4Fe-4S dicluster domain-containing protein n=1 Tax=unclassified Anaeromyxobacter TaxID=2620896 RepID=UPI0005DAC128|nr:4Fe-4S dicluster domain-containing protein [Anaeromyxobacter sp. PSR-1]GAO04755.1 sn-glycerol-3-phosphate dehydrogenase subunit C [Anaeromyxobacter sp. PSR-1]